MLHVDVTACRLAQERALAPSGAVSSARLRAPRIETEARRRVAMATIAAVPVGTIVAVAVSVSVGMRAVTTGGAVGVGGGVGGLSGEPKPLLVVLGAPG